MIAARARSLLPASVLEARGPGSALPGAAVSVIVSLLSIGVCGLVADRTGADVSPLVVAMLVGALLGSLGRATGTLGPGLAVCSRTVLRAGVVLLGLELSVGQLVGLGWRGLTVVAVTVVCTFAGTLALGRALRVPALTRLYVATGFSICGAVAIAAIRGVVPGPVAASGARTEGDAEDGADDALGTSLALVTVYGSLAVLVLPVVSRALGLTGAQAGLWIGASVQEVAQVVAAAGVVSGTALAAATVAKLARVVLLAPLLAVVAVAACPPAAAGRAGRPAGPQGARPRLVPGFVLGFLGAVAVRSLGVLPEGVLDLVGVLRDVMLAAAMFALGTSVDVPRLLRTGRRALALGAAASALCAGVALLTTLVLT